ncbi:acyl carrier protein [Aliarcobacter cryaerophilus]|uniref:acyl carrier protein n=1 Tax=Aliarcobacter cryaerophilus TaxID=28198 RepID=UPI003DA3DD0D
MELEKKLELLADLLELQVNEFSPETNLDDLEEWDSLAAISYVVMMDEEFGIVANPTDIKNFKTIQDILDSMK